MPKVIVYDQRKTYLATHEVEEDEARGVAEVVARLYGDGEHGTTFLTKIIWPEETSMNGKTEVVRLAAPEPAPPPAPEEDLDSGMPSPWGGMPWVGQGMVEERARKESLEEMKLRVEQERLRHESRRAEKAEENRVLAEMQANSQRLFAELKSGERLERARIESTEKLERERREAEDRRWQRELEVKRELAEKDLRLREEISLREAKASAAATSSSDRMLTMIAAIATPLVPAVGGIMKQMMQKEDEVGKLLSMMQVFKELQGDGKSTLSEVAELIQAASPTLAAGLQALAPQRRPAALPAPRPAPALPAVGRSLAGFFADDFFLVVSAAWARHEATSDLAARLLEDGLVGENALRLCQELTEIPRGNAGRLTLLRDLGTYIPGLELKKYEAALSDDASRAMIEDLFEELAATSAAEKETPDAEDEQ
ncbi:MAG: hypothetical protein V2A58_16725 [Planctomycetota bacterium]